MDGSKNKLQAAQRGRLPPSKIHRSLQFLDKLADNEYTAPLLRTFLAVVFWLVYSIASCVMLVWSIYPSLHQAVLYVLTFWRVDMLTGPQPGPRVKQRELSSSRVFSVDDVKLCQQAFSGPHPGSSVKGVPKEKRDSVKHKRGHVTLNDVVCSVMADVLGREIAAKPDHQLNGPSEWMKRWLKGILPSPIGFFMYVCQAVILVYIGR